MKDESESIYESKIKYPVSGFVSTSISIILILVFVAAFFLNQMSKGDLIYLPIITIGALILIYSSFSLESQKIIINNQKMKIFPNRLEKIFRYPVKEYELKQVEKVRRISNWVVFEMKNQSIKDKKDLKEYEVRMHTTSWRNSQIIFDDVKDILMEQKRKFDS